MRTGWGVGLGCVLSLSAGVGWGQSVGPAAVVSAAAPARKTEAGVVSGTVVDAVTGVPVPGARVTLSRPGAGAVVASAQADEAGRFALRGLAAGKYGLSAQAPGYVEGSYQEHDEFSTAVVVGGAWQTEGLRMELRPEAAIRGRVTDEVGDGVRDARVTLYREAHDEGRPSVEPVTTAMTDDRGEYEAGPLRAGKYFVSVKARPWWAMYGHGTGASPHPALDVAYPLTYAPGVTDAGRATAVQVAPGEVGEADVALVPEPAVTLTVRRSPGEPSVPGVLLRVPAFDTQQMVQGEMDFRDGAMVVHGLAPGEYQMETLGSSQRMGRVTVGEGGVEMTDAAVGALGTVEATVRAADGASLPGGTLVQLERAPDSAGHGGGDSDGAERPFGEVRDNGSAEMTGVPPGRYRVLALDHEGPLTVERLAQGGRAVPPGGTVTVGDGTTAVEVVVGPSAQGVDGTVMRDGKPVGGAMVVLVPVDAEGMPAMYRRDQSDQDGTFTLRRVVAGRYIAVAVVDGWGLDWSRRGVMERYLGKGVAVEVRPGTRGVVRLPRPVEAQAR